MSSARGLLGVVLVASLVGLILGTAQPAGAGTVDTTTVVVVPNPYTVSGRTWGPRSNVQSFERIRFTNVPEDVNCTIKIFSSRGYLIATLRNEDGSPNILWDGRNEDNQYIVSDVYLYVVESPGVPRQIGKFIVLR